MNDDDEKNGDSNMSDQEEVSSDDSTQNFDWTWVRRLDSFSCPANWNCMVCLLILHGVFAHYIRQSAITRDQPAHD